MFVMKHDAGLRQGETAMNKTSCSPDMLKYTCKEERFFKFQQFQVKRATEKTILLPL